MRNALIGSVGIIVDPARAVEVTRAAEDAAVSVAWIEPSIMKAMKFVGSAPPSVVFVEWVPGPLEFRDSLLLLACSPRRPRLAIVGVPERGELFSLAKAGVDAYFDRFATEAFRAVFALPIPSADDLLRHAARASLGRLGVKEAQKVVRREMFCEALTVAGGNRHEAARTLRVDRRYVRKMANESSR